MATYLSPAPPRILAHRGLATSAVENTHAAFQSAIDLGIEFLETDTHVTRDGVPVLWHDPTLERFDGSADRIDRLTWSELRNRMVGTARIISLAEALDSFPTAKFNVDLKIDAVVDPAAAVVANANAVDRVLFASFSEARRTRAAELLPGVATSVGTAGMLRIISAQLRRSAHRERRWRAAAVGAVAVQVPRSLRGVRIVTPAFISAAHAAGLEVHVWTINDPEEMRELRVMGVDGIVTDRSDLALEAFGLSTAP